MVKVRVGRVSRGAMVVGWLAEGECLGIRVKYKKREVVVVCLWVVFRSPKAFYRSVEGARGISSLILRTIVA